MLGEAQIWVDAWYYNSWTSIPLLRPSLSNEYKKPEVKLKQPFKEQHNLHLLLANGEQFIVHLWHDFDIFNVLGPQFFAASFFEIFCNLVETNNVNKSLAVQFNFIIAKKINSLCLE